MANEIWYTTIEIVHLPVEVSNIETTSFKGCKILKVIYIPEKNVVSYKERFPDYMHWLIVEEGSDLPVWYGDEYDEEHYDVHDIMYDIMYDEVYKEDEDA